MCKEGWSIELGQEGVAGGEDASNTLKGGGTEKREGEIKTPLRNCDPIKTFTSNP